MLGSSHSEMLPAGERRNIRCWLFLAGYFSVMRSKNKIFRFLLLCSPPAVVFLFLYEPTLCGPLAAFVNDFANIGEKYTGLRNWAYTTKLRLGLTFAIRLDRWICSENLIIYLPNLCRYITVSARVESIHPRNQWQPERQPCVCPQRLKFLLALLSNRVKRNCYHPV